MELDALGVSIRPPVVPGQGRVETGGVDYFAVVYGVVNFVPVIGVISYLLANRDWPPVRVRNVDLHAITTGGGIMWWIGFTLLYGLFKRDPSGVLANNCLLFDYTFTYLGLGLFISGLLTLFYRSFLVFIRHAKHMYPPAVHVAVGMLSWLSFLIYMYVFADDVVYDENVGYCTSGVADGLAYVALFITGLQLTLMTWLHVRLSRVKTNLASYEELRFALVLAWTAVILFPMWRFMLWNDFQLIARAGLNIIVTSMVVTFFWSMLGRLFFKTIKRDPEYLHRFTYGLEDLPSPASYQTDADAELAKVKQQLASVSDPKQKEATLGFFLALRDRQQAKDWFVVQAITMGILDDFVRVGSPHQIKLDSRIRRHLMETDDLNRPDMFNDAKDDVMNRLATLAPDEDAPGGGDLGSSRTSKMRSTLSRFIPGWARSKPQDPERTSISNVSMMAAVPKKPRGSDILSNDTGMTSVSVSVYGQGDDYGHAQYVARDRVDDPFLAKSEKRELDRQHKEALRALAEKQDQELPPPPGSAGVTATAPAAASYTSGASGLPPPPGVGAFGSTESPARKRSAKHTNESGGSSGSARRRKRSNKDGAGSNRSRRRSDEARKRSTDRRNSPSGSGSERGSHRRRHQRSAAGKGAHGSKGSRRKRDGAKSE